MTILDTSVIWHGVRRRMGNIPRDIISSFALYFLLFVLTFCFFESGMI